MNPAPKPRKRIIDRKVYEKVQRRDGTCLWGMLHHDGCEGRLHVHHIKYRSRGGDDTMDNLITLCAKHHREAHAGKITPEQLFNTLNHWKGI